MIPKLSNKNVGLSIIILLILCYIIGNVIIPKITTNLQLGRELYFMFSVVISILYTLWFLGKIK